MKKLLRKMCGVGHSILRAAPGVIIPTAIACPLAGTLYAQDNSDEARSLTESVAAAAYGFAWPTATFESVTVGSLAPVDGGFDGHVRLSGISAFGGGELWMEVVFELRGGGLSDVRVVRHNAFLVAPFKTSKAVAEFLVEFADQVAAAPSPVVRRLAITNECERPVKLAIHYRKLDGTWRSVGWWSVGGNESKHLTFNNGESAQTTHTLLYFYAETEDRELRWMGDAYEATVDGRKLPMASTDDSEGDVDWAITCPDR